MIVDPQVVSALITAAATFIVTGAGGVVAYVKLAKKARETVADAKADLAVESKRIEEQVEQSIWERAQKQLKEMDDQVKEANRRFAECESHRSLDQIMLFRMRVSLASLEMIIIAMKQEMEKSGVKIPFPHMILNLAGDDGSIFTESVRKLFEQERAAEQAKTNIPARKG